MLNLALTWNAWDDDLFIQEASSDPTIKRAQRAAAAAREILSDRYALERTTVQQLLTRLNTLKTSLQARVLGEAGGVTDFRRFTANALIADVDVLIRQATDQLARIGQQSLDAAADLGEQHADEPVKAAQLTIRASMPGLDRQLVTAAFDNTADLLTSAMQQFRGDVVTSIRRVATAGDNRMTEINRLRDKISSAGIDGAAFKAERIVRTEVGRVFNMATYTRMTGLAADFPFLKKGWRAARDNRTRQGHREAHQLYTRGQGIPIADRFQVNVYNERPGKPVVLLGVARLRFPVDPDAEPAGRLAAGSTIMCRCGAFVDFDLAQFAQFAKDKVTVAIGDVRGPAPEPEPVPVPPKKQPTVRKPKLPKPKALPAVVPGQVVGKPKPQGTPISAHAKVDPNTKYRKVREAYALLDSVHGDGTLRDIDVGAPDKIQKGLHAYYMSNAWKLKNLRGQISYSKRKPKQYNDIAFTGRGLSGHPLNTTWHETGHWLDNRAFVAPKFGQQVVPDDAFASEYNDSPAWDAWRNAAKGSPTIQRLQRWGNAAFRPVPGTPMQPDPVYGHQGDGDTPMGVHRGHVGYLLKSKEVWARAYAQYIAVRSGDAGALKELRQMQAAASYGPVKPDAKFNTKTGGKDPDPGSWDYPTVWQDDEFKPIADAIDKILEEKGWRTPGAK
jgi:hypothetical protein